MALVYEKEPLNRGFVYDMKPLEHFEYECLNFDFKSRQIFSINVGSGVPNWWYVSSDGKRLDLISGKTTFIKLNGCNQIISLSGDDIMFIEAYLNKTQVTSSELLLLASGEEVPNRFL